MRYKFDPISGRLGLVDDSRRLPPFLIQVDTEFLIREYEQLVNYNGFTVRGQLILRGNLVLR